MEQIPEGNGASHAPIWGKSNQGKGEITRFVPKVMCTRRVEDTARRRVARDKDKEAGRGQDVKASAGHSSKFGFNHKCGKKSRVGLEKQCDQSHKYLCVDTCALVFHSNAKREVLEYNTTLFKSWLCHWLGA